MARMTKAEIGRVVWRFTEECKEVGVKAAYLGRAADGSFIMQVTKGDATARVWIINPQADIRQRPHTRRRIRTTYSLAARRDDGLIEPDALLCYHVAANAAQDALDRSRRPGSFAKSEPSGPTAKFPDTLAGAKAMLKDAGYDGNLGGVAGMPDPVAEGVWLVYTKPYPIIAYLAGYREPFGNIRESNDFEEVEP